jgi:hypothetical protein
LQVDSSYFRTNTLRAPPCFPCMPRTPPISSFLFDHPSRIWWTVQKEVSFSLLLRPSLAFDGNFNSFLPVCSVRSQPVCSCTCMRYKCGSAQSNIAYSLPVDVEGRFLLWTPVYI